MNIKRKLLRIFSFSLIFIGLFLSFTVNASTKYPTPTNLKYINDYVGLMNNTELQNIISIGKELEDKTSAEAVVVIIDSTNGQTIEEYALSLFRTWGIGKKDKDNGLLMLISLNDRSWRIEVGRGLEGAIPDVLSSRIMDNIAVPNFKEGNYGTGIIQSYSTLCDFIAKEYGITLSKSLNIPLPQDHKSFSDFQKPGAITLFFIIILFFIDMFFNRGRLFSAFLNLLFWNNISNRRGGGGNSNGGFGGFGGGNSGGGGSSGKW